MIQNPATSSPGLAFLLATVGHFGPRGMPSLAGGCGTTTRGGADGSEDAYWEQFSACPERHAGRSWSATPTARRPRSILRKKPLDEAPTVRQTHPGPCFQIEFVGILKGTPRLALARQLVDFMLDRSFQEDILPLQMFVPPTAKRSCPRSSAATPSGRTAGGAAPEEIA